jgi:hypothetical protein
MDDMDINQVYTSIRNAKRNGEVDFKKKTSQWDLQQKAKLYSSREYEEARAVRLAPRTAVEIISGHGGLGGVETLKAVMNPSYVKPKRYVQIGEFYHGA